MENKDTDTSSPGLEVCHGRLGVAEVDGDAFRALVAALDLPFKVFGSQARTAQRLITGQGAVRNIVAERLKQVLANHGATEVDLGRVFPTLRRGRGAVPRDLDHEATVQSAHDSLEHSTHPWWVGDATGAVVFINRAMARFLGLAPEERDVLVACHGAGATLPAVASALLQDGPQRAETLRRQAAFMRWLYAGDRVTRSSEPVAVQDVAPLREPRTTRVLEFPPGAGEPALVSGTVTGIHIHCDVCLDDVGRVVSTASRLSEFPSGAWTGVLQAVPDPRPRWWPAALQHLALSRPGPLPGAEDDPVFQELGRALMQLMRNVQQPGN